MPGRTVRVRGLPPELPPDRAADKLTIHFLRSRNGGGEIADVEVVPGPQPCALITFEALEVAQRVLEAKEHVLSVGGKKYPLEVTAHGLELSPDQIFIRTGMVVDYGKVPAGKSLLNNLLQGYSNVQFDFDPKNSHCIVKGSFTELQAFSRDFLGSLNLKSRAAGEILLPGSSHVAEETRRHGHQQVPDSSKSGRETPKLPDWNQVCDNAAKEPAPRGPVDGEAVGELDYFSLVMDSDIYLYMQRFCAAEYQGVLHQHHVDVVDVSSDGIAMLYLQPSAAVSGDTGALQQACLALQQLHQQLELSLRKEKITKQGLDVDSQALRTLMHKLQKLYPQLLCHEDEKQLYLIGNLVDVSQAKQYLQDFSTRRDAAGTAGSSLPSHPAASCTAEAALHKPRVPAATSTSRLSPGRQELKGELKLAANFRTLKADKSQSSQGLFQNQDSALVGQAQQKDPKEWDHMKGDARLTRPKALSPLGGKENSTLQHPGDSKGSDAIKPHSLTGMASTFDVTRTDSAVDSKPFKSRPLLRRSSSFSLPRSKEDEKAQGADRAGSGGSRVCEELSLDSLQWSYLKDVCHAALSDLCRAGAVQIAEHRAGDCTVLRLQAADSSKLLQAKWKVEALVQKCPDLVCRSMSYSELTMNGPDDSALDELCSLLRRNSLQVALSKDKYKLCLACPKETLPAVTEVFRSFSSRRLHALKSSFLSPGPESTGQSSVIQPSRIQGRVLGAALSGGLESLQDLSTSSKANDAEVLGAAQLPEAQEKRSPSPRMFQQAPGQEEANDQFDSGAGQGGSSLLSPSVVDKPSPVALRESQEQPKRKLAVWEPDIARLKQVLPDRFQFARDKSRVGCSEAVAQRCSPAPVADPAPCSLPTWMCRAPEAAAQQPPAAEPWGQERAQLPTGRSSVQEEPDLSLGQAGGPSPVQESSKTPLGRCDACQGSGVTCQAPCGHSLCRTCFAEDSTQPACCSCSSLAPRRKISGTFKISSLSQNLPGYYRDPTLQVAYNIPDGVQGAGDPHPGQPYKGGKFYAFLPDNRDGQKTVMLLKKAFEHGLTFQIKSCNGEERVTWGLIPHKTSWDGGKARNGYPDRQYLGELCQVLHRLGIA